VILHAQQLRTQLPGAFCDIEIVRSLDSVSTIVLMDGQIKRVEQNLVVWADGTTNSRAIYSKHDFAYYAASLANNILRLKKYKEDGTVLHDSQLSYGHYTVSYFVKPRTNGGIAVLLYTRLDNGGSYIFSSVLLEFDEKLNRTDSVYFHDRKVVELEYLPSGEYCVA
jgi:hypothetical protein